MKIECKTGKEINLELAENLFQDKIITKLKNKAWISAESLLRFFEVAMNEETGEVDWNMCQELKMKLEK